MAITQTISAYPTPLPDRDDDTPVEFSDHVDSFLGHQNTNVTEVNAWAVQCNAVEANVNAKSDNSDVSAALALVYKNEAEASQNATEYSGAATYNIPDTVIGTDGHAYRCIIDATTADDPVGSVTAHWLQITVASEPIEVQNFAFSIM